ncbi:MAG: hypothetical protein WB053_12215, partial [Nitrososphaeraceae archaeon]
EPYRCCYCFSILPVRFKVDILMPRKYGYSIGSIGHGISVISSLLALSNVPRPVSAIINLRKGLKSRVCGI